MLHPNMILNYDFWHHNLKKSSISQNAPMLKVWRQCIQYFSRYSVNKFGMHRQTGRCTNSRTAWTQNAGLHYVGEGTETLHTRGILQVVEPFYKIKFIKQPRRLSESSDALCLFNICACTLEDTTVWSALFSRQWVGCVGDSEDVFLTHEQPGTECCSAAAPASSTTETVPLAGA